MEQYLQITDPNTPRLTYLAHGLSRKAGSLIYVNYRKAENDCEQLAVQLLAHYSRQELSSFSFLPIPRGGFIVLGILSYILDLDPAQLQPHDDPSRPAVLVDDCALTGARFGQQLNRTPAEQILFLHLYSHPQLRSAILERESRVKTCLAAHDLADRAPEKYTDPEEYQAWQDRWAKRLGPQRYWFGLPDPICFAWTEPDHPFFNPVTGRVEDGWRFLPPNLCLKNRVRLGLPPRSPETRVWHSPAAVVSGLFDDELWLVDTRSENVYKLTDVAAVMWRALVAYGRIDVTVDYIAELYDVDHLTLQNEVESFEAELQANGLLQRAGETNSPNSPDEDA